MKLPLPLRCLALACAALLGATAVAPALAAYPEKQVRLIVPYPPGGLGDRSARLIAESLADQWKQPVVVDNRPGASVIIASQAVTNAPKDGYTLYLCNTQNATNEVLLKSIPYKLADMAPVSLIVRFPFALITTPSVPANNVAELIDYARKNPGKVNFATFGPTSSSNFLAHAFAAQHGLNIVTVPYKGSSQVIPDLMSGTVQAF
ncbi:MAG: tripartite tricarboxylate transporter substrate binding protein, partial [Desulfobacterales bacterium]|nr:tripartite tricarboxylate transporter substrate binding protein [Desulfobacterales bacterium]